MTEEKLKKGNEIKRKLDNAREFRQVMSSQFAYITVKASGTPTQPFLDAEYTATFRNLVDGIIDSLETQLKEL